MAFSQLFTFRITCSVFVILLSVKSVLSTGHRRIGPHGYSAQKTDIQYKTRYFSQQVDHFSYSNQDTFQQRYLIADQYWNAEFGPIFFYTGNEGDIAWFCNNTGLMWDWAPQLRALLIFAEHRYYGDSLPYGKESYTDLPRLGYLSSEQALADFVTLLAYVKSTVAGLADKPVIAFGGSYGGMLAAWLRIKYPHVVQGALAASAPIWMFGDQVPCGSFYKTVTDDFKREGAACSDNIAKSWSVITDLGKTDEGRASLSKTFGLCKSLHNAEDISTLKSWLSETYVNLAMVDYPYAADFLEPLPGWPIKEVCKHLLSTSLVSSDLVAAIADGVQVYYNYTGTSKCLDISQQATQDLGDKGWDFQACTEMVMPICSDGKTDMFEPQPWDYAKYAADCKKTWGATPRPDWIIQQFGGKNISSASNIIFSNGNLDPWSVGGVLASLSDSLVSVHVTDGAHHLDLRAESPHDPPSVIKAREQEKTIIRSWISVYWTQQSDSWELLRWPSLYMFKSSIFGEGDMTAPEDDSLGDSGYIVATLIFAVGAGVIVFYLGLAQNIKRHLDKIKHRNIIRTPELASQADVNVPEKLPLI